MKVENNNYLCLIGGSCEERVKRIEGGDVHWRCDVPGCEQPFVNCVLSKSFGRLASVQDVVDLVVRPTFEVHGIHRHKYGVHASGSGTIENLVIPSGFEDR